MFGTHLIGPYPYLSQYNCVVAVRKKEVIRKILERSILDEHIKKNDISQMHQKEFQNKLYVLRRVRCVVQLC